MSKVLTTKELSAYLKLNPVTIYRYAAQGLIPAVRLGKIWRFDRETIDKWINGGGKSKKETGIERRKPRKSKSKKSKKGEKG